MTRLRELTFFPLDIPLEQPFGIATGVQLRAENVLVRLELDDGTVGWGEAAPVPHISGESRPAALATLADAEQALKKCRLSDYRTACAGLAEVLAPVPSALAAVETALFDALCKSRELSLCSFFGGAEWKLPIDVTITTGTEEQGRESAARYAKDGFSVLKIKVGAGDLDQDAARVRAIAAAAPTCQLLLDGNTAYSVGDALRLIEEVGAARTRIALFEQPVARDDYEGLREVEQKSNIPVAADESLRSREDFRTILATGGISAVNLKTAKLGLLAAWDLLIAARSAGLKVMVGGMVETEISMSASACLAAGVGGVLHADLDTPLFLGSRPIRSSIRPWGPLLDLSRVRAGHGASYASELPALEVEA